MRLVILSDTHGLHDSVRVPDGDVLIHCGDCTNDQGQAALRSFLTWMQKLPHASKLFIAGNHDWAFEKWPDPARSMVRVIAPSVEYLQDSIVEIGGKKFYGSPWQPEFCHWAFNLPRGEKLAEKWKLIPDDTDVLITHGPPFGILDVSGFDNEHCGCRDLYARINEVQPDVHCFGHIHHSNGHHKFVHDDGRSTMMVNASICDEKYRPLRQPFIYDLP